MKFVNDRQRKAVFSKLAFGNCSDRRSDHFAQLGCGKSVSNKFSSDSSESLYSRCAAGKLSLKPIEDIKSEYDAIWDSPLSYDESMKESLKFLRRQSKSKRKDVSDWANHELYEIYSDLKTSKEEARFEDASKGRDPDYGRSEEDMQSSIEAERNYGQYSKKPEVKELIPGGYGSGRPITDFDPEQVKMGIEVEQEHVVKYDKKGNRLKPTEDDIAKAVEITSDHLSEIPDYYTRLDKLEEGAKEDGVFIDVDAQKKTDAQS